MCQLLLVNTGSQVLNRIFLSPALQIDASVGNRDGTGFLTVKGGEASLWKTELSADSIENLGRVILQNVMGSGPVMAHVRAASKGIGVTRDNAHPFMGKRFVLAHNGRLYKKGDTVTYWETNADTGLDSDSKVFLDRMESEAKKNPKAGMLEILNTCMSEFMGKFAFLIYDTATGDYYVARGSSADLHIVDILAEKDGGKNEVIGFVLNTKKNCLMDSVMIASPIAQMTTKSYIKYGEPTELNKDTLYVVRGNALEIVGELKENTVVYTNSYQAPVGRGVHSAGTAIGSVASGKVTRATKLADRVYKFIDDHFLTNEQLDIMMESLFGVPMALCDVTDLNILVNDVIPKISAPEKTRKAIKNIITSGGKLYDAIYGSVPGMEFPWMLNDKATINRMLSKLRENNLAVGTPSGDG